MQDLKIMPVEPCKATGKLYSSASEFRHRLSGSFREPSMLTIANRALSELEAARKLDIETHDKNVPAMENNRLVVQHLTAVNTALGMPDGWTTRDTNSRARIPKSIRHQAGWKQDIAQHVKTDDGFELATSTYNRLLATYTQYHADAVRDDEQKKGAAARAETEKLAKRKADLEFVQICQRYSLPLESEWSDVLEELRKRDQRLDLAIAMQDVRNDWNEGCGAVEYALGRFVIRDNEDKDIAADVLGCTRDFEDGRVFRDTTWNYNRLIASVQDRQLVADAEIAVAQSARY